jgi:RNA polymerase sigma-70 factor (ECF subfamily)
MRRDDGARDEELIRALYFEHGRSLLAYASRLTGDRVSAEDVVQETLLRAWKHADAIVNGKGSVRGWLLTVARNIINDQVRARAARPVEVEQAHDAVPIERDPTESIVNMMTMFDALAKLSPDHRSILIELYYRDRSMPEAAQRLGIAPGTVKSRSHYALRALHALLSAEAESEART